ncbi:unnamed protein product [Phaedon cochleariae]|uniref:SET domain-containing protein n=1 Tax=Phaedon cochleariae TaxID=80249 RepID=A0A9P0DFS7_PHACE|nr:unnamed protein product [Phaedon cochleariae]
MSIVLHVIIIFNSVCVTHFNLTNFDSRVIINLLYMQNTFVPVDMSEENYYISKNDKFGRFMVAKKNIKAGELILSELPIMVGSPIDGPLICFNCCNYVKFIGSAFCKDCHSAILCSSKCTGIFHTKEECESFKKASINGTALAENNQVIFPLRCLFLKKYKPEVWKHIMELEAHLENRRDNPIWRRHKIAVEQNLRHMNLLSEEDIASEMVQKICGILDVNTFELRPRQNKEPAMLSPGTHHCLRGLYSKAALMAHDCTGNTLLSVDDDFVLTIKASIDIQKDGPILFSYANVLNGTVDRKQHLLEGKYFECTCERCSDPTESNTEISSLKCHNCNRGTVRMKDTAIVNSDWICSDCQKTFRYFLMNLAVEEGRRKIQEIDRSDMEAMENLLSKLLQTFHENHFLILETKQSMIGLYTYMPPTRNNLQKKIRLCQSLIEVFSKLEPGISRMKAMALYQLQSSLIDLANKEYNDGLINLEELFSNLMNAEMKLKESITYLLYEPPRTPEGRITKIALSELNMLRASIANIKNDLLFVNLISNKKTTIKNIKGDKSCNIDKTLPTKSSTGDSDMESIRRKRNKNKHK